MKKKLINDFLRVKIIIDIFIVNNREFITLIKDILSNLRGNVAQKFKFLFPLVFKISIFKAKQSII